ncbi:hypothetical protein GW17_00032263 [Ensete ventricosum]|nr:hypothetical protein GW17_00032263 [Ensete ventricosum]
MGIKSWTSLAPGVLSSGGRANTGDANRSEHQNVEQPRQNGSGSGNADPMRGIPARTVVAAIPARPSGETASQVLSVVYPVHVRSQQSGPTHSGSFQGSHPSVGSGMQPNTSVIVPHPSEAGSIPAIVAQVNAHINGAFAGNALGQSSSFTSLQSAAAQGSHPALNSDPSASLPTVLSQFVDGMSLGAQGSQEQVDAGGMISHVLQSPVFNNLLANVAEQTGLGSPADLRSMMEQCTQSPAMRSALNNIVQQVEGEGQDLGSMLLGSGSSEGGIDFSRMIQQMMPMVSQALGRVSSRSPPVTVMGSDEHQPQSNNVIHHVERMQDQNVQIDLREARERIEQCDSSGNIFRAMLEGADNLYGEEISYEDLQELGDDAELGNVCILFLD